MLPVFDTISSLRAALAGKPGIGLVPTMGALHAGHARLIERARERSGTVVVSIFVNPIQFDRSEDYARYGRSLGADAEICARAGADFIFAPSVAEMYPEPNLTAIEVSSITDHFCGAMRPGHFRGVTTVVAKLFNIAMPQLAFFGEKDAQQLAAVARMVRDLNFPLEIVPVETVREPDGLAMSSRNARLDAGERQRAVCLYEALSEVRTRIARGEREANAILQDARVYLERAEVRVEYFGLADPSTLLPVTAITRPVRALGAIWLGETRLIDNVFCPVN